MWRQWFPVKNECRVEQRKVLDINGEMLIIELVNKPWTLHVLLYCCYQIHYYRNQMGINWLEYQAINVIFLINEIVE
jgi:hypothetical protein